MIPALENEAARASELKVGGQLAGKPRTRVLWLRSMYVKLW